MRYLAVLMFVVVFSGLVGCDGSGGLGLGGGRIEPFVFDNCWYEGGIKDTFAHGKGTVYCLRQGQGKVKQPMTDFCYGEMKPCRSGTYSGREYVRSWQTFWLQYDGEWKDGKYHGQGTYTDADRYNTYVGEWKDGKKHGQGTATYLFGNTYVGEFKDGKRHGQGTVTLAEGSVKRKGWWCNDDELQQIQPHCPELQKEIEAWYAEEARKQQLAAQRAAQLAADAEAARTLTYPDGKKYVGDLVDGLPNGQGTMTWPDGATYVGEFKDDKFNGQGTFTFSSGTTYVGDFADGDGLRGTMTWPDGDKYVGELKHMLRDGQGTHTDADGDKYVGEWKDDKKHGQGILYLKDGSIDYQGDWCNDEQGPCQ